MREFHEYTIMASLDNGGVRHDNDPQRISNSGPLVGWLGSINQIYKLAIFNY